MNINYIFLLKEHLNRQINKGKEHYNILNKISDDVSEDKFKFVFNQRLYSVIYKSSYNENSLNMFNLSIMLKKDDVNNSKVLCEINNLINNSEVRKDYNIIVSYDGVSNYYCNQAYNLLNKFERKIRELVYLILTNTFGIRWYEKTISDELEGKIKDTSNGKNKSKLMESALQEMTLYDLEIYLFEPYSDYRFDNMLDEGILNEAKLQEMTKDEIIEQISLCRPKSLWERFFKDEVDIDDIKESISIIRKYRNKVAHSKAFNNSEYAECRNILNKIIKKMDSAIEKLVKLEFDIEEGYRAYSAFSELSKQLEDISKLGFQPTGISKQLKDIGKLNFQPTGISKQLKDIGKLNFQPTGISKQLEDVSKLSFQPKGIGKQLEDMSKLSFQPKGIGKQLEDMSKLSFQPKGIGKQLEDMSKLSFQPKGIGKQLEDVSKLSFQPKGIGKQLEDMSKLSFQPKGIGKQFEDMTKLNFEANVKNKKK
ncbi:Uncharacterised protein [[Clostridium] sordellii]|uniref:hypothetical protein n=1 Tax=Paraclostridium sordellii TaxID=1505 RepID=UPI0005DA7B73|nr:hypothetical protein [Paeniclostridium sordellii]CEP80000.1 Uncharacterised protein [[Clostridium] sordellii] [Paeniclostridium sordellii]